jgi:peptidyl-prolyl cis-trans isomerase C
VKSALVHGLIVLVWLLLPATISAQGTPQPASPAARIDLTKPQFDTTTPNYDVSGVAKKAASAVVAEVEGRSITLGDVGDAIREMPPGARSMPFDTVYPEALKPLIQIQALVVRAQRLGLDADPAVLRRAKLAYDKILANAALVRDASAGITEKMLLDRYDRDVAGKPGSDEAEVSIIMVATEAMASEFLAELARGADFATVARRESKDSSAGVGGDLGFQRREVLAPQIGAVAFSLLPGQTAARPVRTSDGWFVVHVGQHRQSKTPTFAAIRDDLRIALLNEAMPALAEAARRGAIVHTFDLTGKHEGIVEEQQP